MSAITFASGLCAGISMAALLMGCKSEWGFLLVPSAIGLAMTVFSEMPA